MLLHGRLFAKLLDTQPRRLAAPPSARRNRDDQDPERVSARRSDAQVAVQHVARKRAPPLPMTGDEPTPEPPPAAPAAGQERRMAPRPRASGAGWPARRRRVRTLAAQEPVLTKTLHHILGHRVLPMGLAFRQTNLKRVASAAGQCRAAPVGANGPWRCQSKFSGCPGCVSVGA